jgi:hypothetical protein
MDHAATRLVSRQAFNTSTIITDLPKRSPLPNRLIACVDSRRGGRKASQGGQPLEAFPYWHGIWKRHPTLRRFDACASLMEPFRADPR